jgi:hypothetical protein
MLTPMRKRKSHGSAQECAVERLVDKLGGYFKRVMAPKYFGKQHHGQKSGLKS